MERSRNSSVRRVALVGILAAMVFALSMVQIQIPITAFGDKTRLHLGNVMCLLSGVLFGPFVGGLASGIGSMFYDFTNPLYVSEFWITFLTKFAMGFMAGFMAKKPFARLPAVPRALFSGIVGQGVYIVLYIIKTIIMQRVVMGLVWPGVWAVVATKATVSGVNGILAVAGCTILAPILRTALDKAGLFSDEPRRKASV